MRSISFQVSDIDCIFCLKSIISKIFLHLKLHKHVSVYWTLSRVELINILNVLRNVVKFSCKVINVKLVKSLFVISIHDNFCF